MEKKREYDNACAATKWCKLSGNCTWPPAVARPPERWNEHWCMPASDAHCADSDSCSSRGNCWFQESDFWNGRRHECVPRTDNDCERSAMCRLSGDCSVVHGADPKDPPECAPVRSPASILPSPSAPTSSATRDDTRADAVTPSTTSSRAGTTSGIGTTCQRRPAIRTSASTSLSAATDPTAWHARPTCDARMCVVSNGSRMRVTHVSERRSDLPKALNEP